MTDFAGRLMRSKPDVPPLIVLEECPVLIPQNAFGMQAQLCKAAVAKLATIGGNFGYGVLPACQRPAVMDKDVLSQCDALIVMGITHKKDRVTIKEWMEAKDIGDRAAAAFNELGSLQPGEAWYWSPGEGRFEKFVFRKRRTLHPREMRKLGLKQGSIKLGDMASFVERAKRELTKTSAPVPESPRKQPLTKRINDELFDRMAVGNEKMAQRIRELEEKVQGLHQELASERGATQNAERRLNAVREHLRPQYDALRGLFEQIGLAPTSGGSVNMSRFVKILENAPKAGIRSMMEYILEHGRANRQQLQAIAGVAKTTRNDYIGWILRTGAFEEDGNDLVPRKM